MLEDVAAALRDGPRRLKCFREKHVREPVLLATEAEVSTPVPSQSQRQVRLKVKLGASKFASGSSG